MFQKYKNTLGIILLFLATVPPLFLFVTSFFVGYSTWDTRIPLHGEQLSNASMIDFMYFWGVGNFIDNGHIHDLINFKAYSDYLGDHVTHAYKVSYWAYPPTINFMICALGLLPIGIAYVVWQVLNPLLAFKAFYNITKSKILTFLIIFSPVAFVNYHYAQTGMLLASLIALGLYYNQGDSKIDFKWDKNVLSGIILGLATIKFPFVILLPVYLLFSKSWKTLFYMIVTTLSMIVASIAVFGLQAWTDYIYTLAPWMTHELLHKQGDPNILFVSPLIAAHLSHLSWNVSWAIQLTVTITSILALIWTTMKHSFVNKMEQIAFIMSMVLIVTPYGHTYDMIITTLPLLLCLIKNYRNNNWLLTLVLFSIWSFWGFTDYIRYLHMSLAPYMNLINCVSMMFVVVLLFIQRDRQKNVVEEVV